MSLLLFLGVLSASAQAEQKGTTEYVFQPHWYIMLQGGGQYTLGEGSFSDLFSPNAQVALGYNFTKVVGLRLSVNAWQSKGVIKLDDTDMTPAQSFEGKWKWNYVAPSLELMFNLSNIVCNYNPTRLLNVYAFVGGGANIAWKNDQAQNVEAQIAAYQNTNPNLLYDGKQNMRYLWDGSKVNIFGKGGLIFDFRVSDKVSINIEGNANILTDKYNSKKAGNADWYFNALAGVKINLGKTYTTKFTPAPEPEVRYVEKVVEKIVEVPAKVEVKPIEKIRRDIFFTINSFKVRDTEQEKIKDIADYLQAHPNAKVEVTGYADAGTGNNRINDRLAKQRADVVVKALMNQYNISADRITFDSKGSRVQPFAENDLNRVTICIAE
ncbi:MAG: OmpA family protein [Prevotella sp.]|nr:OmpA family protein [Prevotella sp.]